MLGHDVHTAGQRQRFEIRFFISEHHPVFALGLDRLDLLQVGTFARRLNRLGHDEIEAEHHVVGGQRLAVGEGHVVAQIEADRQAVVADRPAFGNQPSQASVSGLRLIRLSCT